MKPLHADAGGKTRKVVAVKVEVALDISPATRRHGRHARAQRGSTREAGVARARQLPVEEGDVPAVGVLAAVDPVASGTRTSCWKICFVLGNFRGSTVGSKLSNFLD